MSWAKTIATLLAIAGLLACGTPTWTSPKTTNKPRKNVTVQFSDASLHPNIARVLPGGNVAWLNYTSAQDASVLFDESIRDAFTCADMRPLFMKVAAGYQSVPITPDSMENVTLPCPLKPGTYQYKLLLFPGGSLMGTGGGGGGAEMGNPTSQMEGTIIVGE